MKRILVSSSEPYSGKSAICIGIGLLLRERGLEIGYMKPVGNLITDVDGEPVEEDAIRARDALKLSDPLNLISPVLLTDRLVEDALSGVKKRLKERIKDAFSKVSRGKDFMLLEGCGDIGGGAMLGLSGPDVAKLLGAKILLVSRYDTEYTVDRILNDLKLVSPERVIGVVLNDVGYHNIKTVKKRIVPFLKKRGVEVLGIVERDNVLKSVTIKDVVERMHGRVLAGKENLDGLITSFIVGAMSPEYALKYFRRTKDKAVITGGDRSDILMAALETPTKCLILTGNLHPSAQVLARAEELQVPVILVSHDTLTAIHIAEELMARIRVTEEKKLKRIKQLVAKNVDINKIMMKA